MRKIATISAIWALLGAIQLASAAQPGDAGVRCKGQTPFDLVHPEKFTDEQTCEIPKLINDIVMNRHRRELSYCFERSLMKNKPEAESNVHLTLVVSEGKIQVLELPGWLDMPMDMQSAFLQQCVGERLERIRVPTDLIKADQPWTLEGTLRFRVQ